MRQTAPTNPRSAGSPATPPGGSACRSPPPPRPGWLVRPRDRGVHGYLPATSPTFCEFARSLAPPGLTTWADGTMFQSGRRAFPPSTWAWKAGRRGADCLAQLTADRIWCRCGVGSARACAARVTTVRSENQKELSPERTRSSSTAPAGPASSLVWRPRTEHDPAQRWLRDTCARSPSASTPDRPTAPGNMGRRPR